MAVAGGVGKKMRTRSDSASGDGDVGNAHAHAHAQKAAPTAAVIDGTPPVAVRTTADENWNPAGGVEFTPMRSATKQSPSRSSGRRRSPSGDPPRGQDAADESSPTAKEPKETSPLSILDVSQMESPLLMPPPPSQVGPLPQAALRADGAPQKKRQLLHVDVERQPLTGGAQLCFVEPSPHTPHDALGTTAGMIVGGLARLDSIEGRPGTTGMHVCPLTPKAARHRSRRFAYERGPAAAATASGDPEGGAGSFASLLEGAGVFVGDMMPRHSRRSPSPARGAEGVALRSDGVHEKKKRVISLASMESCRFLLESMNTYGPTGAPVNDTIGGAGGGAKAHRRTSSSEACGQVAAADAVDAHPGRADPEIGAGRDGGGEEFVISRRHSLSRSWPGSSSEAREYTLAMGSEERDTGGCDDEGECGGGPHLSRMRSLRDTRVLMNVNVPAAGGGLRRSDSLVDSTLFDFLDQFEIVSVIGRSEMSEVYKVRNKKYGSFSAVKRTRHAVVSYCERSRQLNEINSVRDLPCSRHVVQYFRCWQQDGFVYTEMELCARGSLRDRLERNLLLEEGGGRPPPNRDVEEQLDEAGLWNLLRQASAGLAHLHAHSIVHLDIKPDNIFIDAEGTYKIGDFGIAFNIRRAPAADVADTPSTGSEGGASTPGAVPAPSSIPTVSPTTAVDMNDDWEEGDGRYCAPELLSISTTVPTTAADVFSLGCSLFECIVGNHFRKYSPRGSKRCDVTPFLAGKCSPELTLIVSRMMSEDPMLRPSATEVVAEAEEQCARAHRLAGAAFAESMKVHMDAARGACADAAF